MFWAKTFPCKIAVTWIATTENPNPVTDAGDVETGRRAVIQACKLEFRIMRCELADHEWVAVSRMLPNKPDEHFVIRVDGRVKSHHRRFLDALREGLQLRDQFPRHDIKVCAQASGEQLFAMAG